MKFVSGVWKRVKISSKSSIPTTGPASATSAAAAAAGSASTGASDDTAGAAGCSTRGGAVRVATAPVAGDPDGAARRLERAARLRGCPGPFGEEERAGGSIGYTHRPCRAQEHERGAPTRGGAVRVATAPVADDPDGAARRLERAARLRGCPAPFGE